MKQDRKLFCMLGIIIAIIVTAGCVGQSADGSNALEDLYNSQKDLAEYCEKQKNITFDAEVKYTGPNPDILNRYSLGEEGFSTNLEINVTTDSEEISTVSVILKDRNTGWVNGLQPSHSVDNSYVTYVYSFPISEIGYTPEVELCIKQVICSEVKMHCFNETLPAATLDVQIPSPIYLELETLEGLYHDETETRITIINNGVFSARVHSSANFQMPEDPQEKVFISIDSDATTLFPGQSTEITIKARSRINEPFEFTGEAFFVEFKDNLGNYHYRKPFTINVKQT